MKIAIWKYKLAIIGEQKITMPDNAVSLSVQAQDGDVCLWAMVDEEAPLVERTFVIYETGQPISPVRYDNFLATVQIGSFVWHVFQGVR
jgi:hypothetical protein